MADDDRSRKPAKRRGHGLRALWRRWRRGPIKQHPRHDDPPAETDAASDIVDQAEAFKTLRVEDVMTPRADIVAVEIASPFADVLARFIEAEHTRMPIYRETLDDPVGQVHIKDVFKLLADEALRPAADEPVLRRLRREILYVPGSMRAADLLVRMQASRMHMALVIDEFGGTDGLVTLEDVIEAVVGEIDDEYDEVAPAQVVARPGGVIDADGRAPLEDLEHALGMTLAPPDLEEDIDTVAGLVGVLAGRVPQRGEVIAHPDGLELEITDADPRRIKRVRIRRVEPPEAADAGPADGSAAEMISLFERRWAASLAALVAGAGAAVTFPPFGVLPGLLGYGLLMILLDTANAERPLRSAFWRGWLAGAAFFLISTWWISEAFYVDATAHGWQAPFAVAGLAAGLGLFWGAVGLAYRALKPSGPLRALVFAGVFCLVEWVRGHLLTGFPWDLAGESWAAGSAPSQAASLVGAYGLSWITVAASASLALTVSPDSRRARMGGLVFAVLAIAGLYGFGAARLAQVTAPSPNAPIVRVVQTNTREEAQYTDARFQEIVANYLRLTGQPAAHTPDIVVWPEGALPAALNDFLAPGAWTEVAIARTLKPGQTLLTGGYRVAGPPDAPIFYNSLMAVRDRAGGLDVTATYDKHRLVPFGEYLPMASVLKPLGLAKLVSVGDGFATGPAPRPIAPPGVPRVQPLVCYEALFPGFTRAGAIAAGRAAWIVNVSDDAWFGATYGPLQHLNLARYRAIEEGLPMVRATPTGTSAVIDAHGRIAPGARLDHGAVGVIDQPLPRALPATVFDSIGDGGFWLMIALSATAIIGRITKRRHNGNS